MGLMNFYEQSPVNQEIEAYNIGVTGTVSQFNDDPCILARFKADGDNGGTVFIRTAVGGNDFPLAAGDDTGWIPLTNINHYYYHGNTADDTVYVWKLK